MVPARSLRLAVYGKGGIGKSLVASNLSALFALEGRRVLHVGCDPKGDSTRNLLDVDVVPALDRLVSMTRSPLSVDDLIVRGAAGVECIEAGGPEPGQGCGGLGIVKLFQFLHQQRFFQTAPHDVQVYDVLGDIVCGGFVAPLKYAGPCTTLIVVSEEVHSLYAANQVAKAVKRFEDSGIRLAGLVLNRRGNGVPFDHVLGFAASLGTRVLAVLPRSEDAFLGDRLRQPVAICRPDGDLALGLAALARDLAAFDPDAAPDLTPLPPSAFDDLMRESASS